MGETLNYAGIVERVRETVGGGSDSVIAETLNVSRQTILNWKRGEGLTLSTLERIAKTYGKSLKWLLFGEDRSHFLELLAQSDDLLDANGLYDRICITVGEGSDRRVAARVVEVLGIDGDKFSRNKKQILSQWKKGVPAKPSLLMQVAVGNGINPNWLLTGNGTLRLMNRVPLSSESYGWVEDAAKTTAQLAVKRANEAVTRVSQHDFTEEIEVTDVDVNLPDETPAQREKRLEQQQRNQSEPGGENAIKRNER